MTLKAVPALPAEKPKVNNSTEKFNGYTEIPNLHTVIKGPHGAIASVPQASVDHDQRVGYWLAANHGATTFTIDRGKK